MNDAGLAYRTHAAQGAKPVRLTILLYEQVIRDLGRAGDAMGRHDAEAVARELGHAGGVIAYLQATLTAELGSPVRRNLATFYTMLREKLVEAQVRSSREVLGEAARCVLDVREAWLKVEARGEGHVGSR